MRHTDKQMDILRHFMAGQSHLRSSENNKLFVPRSLFLSAFGRSPCQALPRGTLFHLGYGTHHWHSNSSSVCSRRHCLRDCHRMHLSDSSLLFVHFEVPVCYYYYHVVKYRKTVEILYHTILYYSNLYSAESPSESKALEILVNIQTSCGKNSAIVLVNTSLQAVNF